MKQPRSVAFLTVPILGLSLVTGCKQQPAPVADDNLTSAVQTRISGDSAISSEPIQSSVRNGIATLNGIVSSEAARALAANDAAQIAGIKTVINNLSVQTAAAAAPPPPIVTATPAPAEVMPRPVSRRESSPPASRRRSSPTRIDNTQTATTYPSTSSAIASTPPPLAAAPAPVVRTVTVPSGSILPVRITQTLDSATAQQGQTFSGTIASDVVIDGVTVLRQGAAVAGRVTAVQEAAHFKGSALLSVELTSLSRRGDQIALSTDPYSTEGKGRGKNTAIKTGGGAAVGAVLGGIFGGGKGAAIGAGAGGGLGAGANAITRGDQVQIPAESLIRFRLASPITVRVSGADATPRDPNATTPASDTGRRPLN